MADEAMQRELKRLDELNRQLTKDNHDLAMQNKSFTEQIQKLSSDMARLGSRIDAGGAAGFQAGDISDSLADAIRAPNGHAEVISPRIDAYHAPKIPAFSKYEPAARFLRVEAAFANAQIKRDQAKINALVEALDNDKRQKAVS